MSRRQGLFEEYWRERGGIAGEKKAETRDRRVVTLPSEEGGSLQCPLDMDEDTLIRQLDHTAAQGWPAALTQQKNTARTGP